MMTEAVTLTCQLESSCQSITSYILPLEHGVFVGACDGVTCSYTARSTVGSERGVRELFGMKIMR